VADRHLAPGPRSVSPRFAYALGLTREEIDGKPFIQLIAGPAWETGQFPSSLHDLAERLKRRESFSNLLVRVTINGQQRWWELSGTPKLDENGNFDGFRGVGSDVTEQRESSDKIAHMARYDTLTGLPNRMMLTEALGDALRYAAQWRTRCAFLMIDLDRFKAVNDTLGHLVGDQLLARVSERLKDEMTDNELCGRLGGDEFAIVIRDASDLDPCRSGCPGGDRAAVAPYEVDHHTLYVGASVGSAIGPRDGQTVETLMRNADLALYRSKEDGGGLHFGYEPALHAHAEERRKLEFSLRRALETQRIRAQLPAGGRCRRRDHRQLRGAAALEQPGAWLGQPGQVHSAGRGYPPDRADRRMGAARGVPRSHALAGPRQGRGQRLGRTAARPELCRQRGRRAVDQRASRRSGWRSK
jgi:diguanylate cyclase (GGDEF)-like protein/PAS domain S-box-containing protein